jgi:hypothetical protein
MQVQYPKATRANQAGNVDSAAITRLREQSGIQLQKGHLWLMTEYDRRAGLPSANFAQFCLELLAFVASCPALRDASRGEQHSAC